MKIINKITAVILSFLIALFAFISSVCFVLSRTFSNPEFMINVLEDRGYYDNIFLEYSDTVENLAIPAGVPEGRFSAVISKADFKKDINNIINSAYSNDDAYAGNVIDFEFVYNKFYVCLTDVAIANGFEIDEELIPGLENVATLCAECYQTYVTVPFIDTIGSYASELNRYFVLGAIIGVCFFLFFVVFMFFSRLWRKHALSLLAISFNTVGLMMSLAPAVIFFSGKLRHINISVKSLYDFAVGYSESLLFSLLITGIIFIIFGISLIILQHFISRKKNNPNKKSS